MKLYKFNKYFNRVGTIEGIFIADPEKVEKLIGCPAYFGDALGKYSSISCTIAVEDIKELKVLDSTVDDLIEVIGCSISGYNPFDYLIKDDDDEYS